MKKVYLLMIISFLLNMAVTPAFATSFSPAATVREDVLNNEKEAIELAQYHPTSNICRAGIYYFQFAYNWGPIGYPCTFTLNGWILNGVWSWN